MAKLNEETVTIAPDVGDRMYQVGRKDGRIVLELTENDADGLKAAKPGVSIKTQLCRALGDAALNNNSIAYYLSDCWYDEATRTFIVVVDKERAANGNIKKADTAVLPAFGH